MAFSKLKKLRSMTFFELKNSSNTTANTPLTQVEGRIPCLFSSCLRRLRHYHKIKRLNIVIWFILRGFGWVLRSYLKVVVKQKKITRSRYALVIYDLDFLPRTEPQVVTQYGTQYVSTILIGGGMSPNIMVSKWLIIVSIVPTIQAVKKALSGVPSEIANSINSFTALKCISCDPKMRK